MARAVQCGYDLTLQVEDRDGNGDHAIRQFVLNGCIAGAPAGNDQLADLAAIRDGPIGQRDKLLSA